MLTSSDPSDLMPTFPNQHLLELPKQEQEHRLDEYHQQPYGLQSTNPSSVLDEKSMVLNVGSHSPAKDEKDKEFKIINLAMQPDQHSLVLLVGLIQRIDEKVWIRVRLCSTVVEDCLPTNVNLVLLSESGTVIQEVRSRSYDNCIQIQKFRLLQGKKFSVQVSLNNVVVTKNFVLE